jgi:hypothetical protein
MTGRADPLVAAVPELAILAMLALGLAFLASYAWRRAALVDGPRYYVN